MNILQSVEVQQEKPETVKDIIAHIGEIHTQMRMELRMITDALMDGQHLVEEGESAEVPLPIMDSLRREEDFAAANLGSIVRIREHLF